MIKGIKVMADYCSSGLWVLESGGMIEYDGLKKLPKTLIKELELWIRYYDECWTSDYSRPKKRKLPKLNSWGRKIACEIKKIYPNMKIEHWGEGYDDKKDKFKVLKEQIIL